MKIISKKEAIDLGLKRYFTGKPCPHGHVCERRTVNRCCCECEKISTSRRKKSNRDHINKVDREWRKRNPDRVKEMKRAEYLRSRDKCIERAKRYYNNNKDRVLKKVSDYKKDNPDKVRALNANRRSIKYSAEGSHTKEDIKRLEQLQKMKCATRLVSIRKGYHVDHIHPLSKGGSNDFYNLQLLCTTCNLRKNAKDPLDWARENDRLL